VTAEPILCDGCGLPAYDEHLRRRVEQLELATRFRPIHIGVLLVADAPPAARVDYFYLPATDRATRSNPARAFFDDLVAGCGIPGAAEKSEEACLTEFQRGGFLLAYVVECPLAFPPDSSKEAKRALDEEALARRYGATLVQRIRYSYKPRQILLLGAPTRPLISVLRSAGFDDRLILDGDTPLAIPDANDPRARARFREILRKTVAALPAQSRRALC
jgi:hypothetical protein